MSLFQEALAWIEPAIVSYGAFALFLIIYFESFCIPLPGESALIAAALLAARASAAPAFRIAGQVDPGASG